MITGIAFFVYPVSNLQRSRRFYESMLGLKMESSTGDEWIEYGIGDGTFAITTMDADHKPGLRGGVIGFEVDDLEAEVARLKEQDVEFVVEGCESPVCRFAIISDPDGNHLIIHKRHPAWQLASFRDAQSTHHF